MYGPKWPFLLMMRHTGFPRVDGLSMDPRDLGRHKKVNGVSHWKLKRLQKRKYYCFKKTVLDLHQIALFIGFSKKS